MLTKDNLTYLGAVRTPMEQPTKFNPPGGDQLGFSSGPFSIDFARGEYVFAGKGSRVVRLHKTAPALPKFQTGDMPDLLDRNSVPEASYVDGSMVDPSNGTWNQLNNHDNAGDGRIGGLQVLGDKAIAAGTIYYDAMAEQDVSFLMSEWPLPTDRPVNRTPWRSAAGIGEGWIAGPMCMIPERYRAALKGDMISGESGLPIITRQSFGPCAISWHAKDLLTVEDIPTTLLVGYSSDHTTLGPWGGPANDLYNESTMITGMQFIGDNLVFIGTHGYGDAHYGIGTSDPALVGLPIPGSPYNEHYDAYDPTNSNKGCHCYPYRTQVWVYPVADLIAVVEGRKQYHELVPTWFKLNFPIFGHQYYRPDPTLPAGIPNVNICGIDYDAERQELHVAAASQDSYGWEPAPIVHVFKVNGVPSFPNPRPALDGVEPLPETPPVVVPPPPPPPPPPVVVPPVEPPVDPCAGVKSQLANAQADVAAAQLGRDVANARVAAMKDLAQKALNHALGLKRPDKWVVDAFKAILAK